MSHVSYGYKEKSGGPMDGCVFFRWDKWGFAIPAYLGVMGFAVTLAVVLARKNMPKLGLIAFTASMFVAFSFITMFCGTNALFEGETLSFFFTVGMVGLGLAASFLQYPAKENALKPGGWLSGLLFKRMGSRSADGGFSLGFVHSNDWIDLNFMEVLWLGIITAWCVTGATAKYTDLMKAGIGIEAVNGNKTRAIGRAFSAVSIRLIFLSMATASRNVLLPQLLGVPFERAMKFHKMLGRLQVLFMWIHSILMIAGNPTQSGAQWDDTFSLVRGRNLIPGPLALFMWTALILGSLDFIRRKYWDAFYFMHIQLFFMANILTIFHSRTAAPYIVGAIALFWVDGILRAISKFAVTELKEITLVVDGKSKGSDDADGTSLVKLVLNQSGYPQAPNVHHPGAYIWLSVGGKTTGADAAAAGSTVTTTDGDVQLVVNSEEEADVADAKTAAAAAASDGDSIESRNVMPNPESIFFPPGGLPAFLFFHAMTISAYDPESNDLTIFVKAQPNNDDEWAAQLCQAARDVASGAVNKDDIKLHVGGPHGTLQVDPVDVDECILVSGGIGVTPMAAILQNAVQTGYKGVIHFVWSTRTVGEINAFAYLFKLAAASDNVHISIHYTGKAALDGETGAIPGLNADIIAAKNVMIVKGRPNLEKTFLLTKTEGRKKTTGVYACGPLAQVVATEQFVNAKQGDGHDVYLHRETFDL